MSAGLWLLGLVSVSALTLGLGCQRKQEPVAVAVGETTLTSTTWQDVVPAAVGVERIGIARCSHHISCIANRGSNDDYNYDVCLREQRTRLGIELDGATSCPRGIDRKQLDTCLRTIEREACEDVSETGASLLACRRSELCPSVVMPQGTEESRTRTASDR